MPELAQKCDEMKQNIGRANMQNKGITTLKLSELKPYDNNPRNNAHAVDAVAESIREFGFKVPIIIDRNNVIVAGHTRYLAAAQLGLEEVPCIIADDLTDEQVKAFRLADNKTAELSEWNFDMLEDELAGISLDMSLFGFGDLPEEDTKEKKEKPDVEFSETLEECHNYIVLYFDNDIDWIQAESLFDIKPVQALSTRKDGKVTKSMRRIGVGRVLNGAKALNKILGGEHFADQSELPEL